LAGAFELKLFRVRADLGPVGAVALGWELDDADSGHPAATGGSHFASFGE
jgi:hypothetical protein